MVADHIMRMEKLDHSYRAEYERALKHVSVTAFFGEILLTRITTVESYRGRLASTETVRACAAG